MAEQLQESKVTAAVISSLMALRTKASADQDTSIRIDFSQSNEVIPLDNGFHL